MSTETMNGLRPKSPPQPLSKPPAIPPPPPPVSNLNTKNASTKIPMPRNVHSKSLPVAVHKQNVRTNKLLPVDAISKWHRFGTLLLGSGGDARQNSTCDSEHTPTLNSISPNILKPTMDMDILTPSQRHILSNVIITILSNAKGKKIPNLPGLASRKCSTDGLYSSESDQPDAGSDASDSEHINHLQHPIDDNEREVIEAEREREIEEDIIHDFLHEYSNSGGSGNNNNHCDKESLAKLVMSQKEKLLLMTSIAKYVQSEHEMDTIHRACFNLWKDWYRCYGTITNQFQQAFMAVCESLLGNVDSRALAREPPLIPVNNDKKSVEEITYTLSTQISTLKHAFAVEQLNTEKPAQNVSQIIDAMEPNVWLIVKHIIFEYFKSSYWTQCKFTLFNLFLDQYESVHRKLDREFISSSSFGVYTLICQLCEVHNLNAQRSIQSIGEHNELELFDLDNHDDRKGEHDDDDDDDNNDTGEKDENNEESSSNENVELKRTFSNEELLETLNWYYALLRLETLLNNKRQDYLSLQIYRLYEPMFAAAFEYFEHDEHDMLPLIRSIVDETDYVALQTLYESLLREEKDERAKGVLNGTPNRNKKHKEKETFAVLLSRVIDSCINWICRDLYYNYRTSEFCMLFTQLLADPAEFKAKKEQSRSTRIIRLHERFNLPPDQPLVNSFSCALDTGKFLHQGKIYFFKDYLCFYANMLGIKDTQQKFLLPVTEIKTVARKVTAWVFNNAIEIQMKDGRTFIFRTFMKRDTTFELLQKLISGQIDWEAIEKQQQKELEKEKEKEEDSREGEENENEKKEKEQKEIDEDAEDDAHPKNGDEIPIHAKSSSTLIEKRKKSVMNEISGFVMSAIDVSSAKLLSTDAKLLLQSNKKRPKPNILPDVIEMKSLNQAMYNNKSMNLVQRNRSDPAQTDHVVIGAPVELTKTRSAPTSPMNKKKQALIKEIIKKPSSDSETVEITLCDRDDILYNDESSSTEELEEEECTESKQEMETEITPMMEAIDPVVSNNKEMTAPDDAHNDLTKEELDEKCQELNSMECKWIFTSNPKVEKDFEVIVEFEFRNIGVDEFWDKFWSNNAIFSPMDWIRCDPLTSNVKAEEWTQEDGVVDGDQWFTRNVSCVTKLEDMPAFFPKSISQCSTDQHFRYCKVADYFYVVHKIIVVNDIPFADCYNTHQKTEFRQSATVVMDDNDKASISMSTHCKMYFGVEWKKSTWLKSPVRSRTLLSIKENCVKYCEEINKRILALNKSKNVKKEEINIASIAPNIVSSAKKKEKKRRKISRAKQPLNVEKDNEKEVRLKQKQKPRAAVDVYDDYDFVFKIGHDDSSIRCRLLLSCCTGGCRCNSWLIVLLVILSVSIMLSSLYVIGVLITLISSVSNVLTTSAEYIHLISSSYSPSPPLFNPPYDAMQHINQHINSNNNNDCNQDNDECNILHIEDCNQLIELISSNPSADILHKTYSSLNCKLMLNSDK